MKTQSGSYIKVYEKLKNSEIEFSSDFIIGYQVKRSRFQRDFDTLK